MKRWRRSCLLITLLLLAGAVVNVAVAWVIAATTSVRRNETAIHAAIASAHPSWSSWDSRLVSGTLIELVLSDHVEHEFRVRAQQHPGPGPGGSLRVRATGSGVTWRFAYVPAGPREFLVVDTYATGWPLRALELRSSCRASWWTMEGRARRHTGLRAPQALLDRGLFKASEQRVPVSPLVAGIVVNALFYAAILAVPLTVFPIRRRLRARRGRCPKCGYDLAGLRDADPATPCPECGATR